MADGGIQELHKSICEGHRFNAIHPFSEGKRMNPDILVVVDEATRVVLPGCRVMWNDEECFSEDLECYMGRYVRLQRVFDGNKEKLLCRAGENEFELESLGLVQERFERLMVHKPAINDESTSNDTSAHPVVR
ncbi:MAG: hypothetical protein PHI97_27450 [Desulfobulbus sp.]|nr:hypothetical protein [Desulfobulbus sp.]